MAEAYVYTRRSTTVKNVRCGLSAGKSFDKLRTPQRLDAELRRNVGDDIV